MLSLMLPKCLMVLALHCFSSPVALRIAQILLTAYHDTVLTFASKSWI